MSINIIPKPKKLVEYGGMADIEPFYICEDTSLERYFHAFSDAADKIWGIAFSPIDVSENREYYTPLTETGSPTADVSNGVDSGSACLVALHDTTLEKGGFRLEIGNSCNLFYADCEGLTNALYTVLKIGERTCDIKIRLPQCLIESFPDSSFRAIQIDVARKWHPLDYLYKYVDLAAFYGMNRLIIHFTDDESYTLPSDIYPKLSTENRHYTKAELKALEEYALSRSVMIIPEIDMPGHSARFCQNYPEIFGSCGITEASEKAFSALENIYLEALELFSGSDFIHLGGDEAVLGRWLDSEESVSYMEENGIKDVAELYGHYIGRMCEFIISKGKTPIVWEGFKKEYNGLVPKKTVVVAWESLYQLAPDLAKDGFTLLNASWKPLYVVSPWRMWSPSEILTWNKYKWDHFLEKSPAFGGDKVFVGEDAPVLGGILCAWGDYLKNYESCRFACQLEFKCVMPRGAALSEKLWTSNCEVSPEEFDAAYAQLKDRLGFLWGENPFRGDL